MITYDNGGIKEYNSTANNGVRILGSTRVINSTFTAGENIRLTFSAGSTDYALELTWWEFNMYADGSQWSWWGDAGWFISGSTGNVGTRFATTPRFQIGTNNGVGGWTTTSNYIYWQSYSSNTSKNTSSLYLVVSCSRWDLVTVSYSGAVATTTTTTTIAATTTTTTTAYVGAVTTTTTSTSTTAVPRYTYLRYDVDTASCGTSNPVTQWSYTNYSNGFYYINGSGVYYYLSSSVHSDFTNQITSVSATTCTPIVITTTTTTTSAPNYKYYFQLVDLTNPPNLGGGSMTLNSAGGSASFSTDYSLTLSGSSSYGPGGSSASSDSGKRIQKVEKIAYDGSTVLYTSYPGTSTYSFPSGVFDMTSTGTSSGQYQTIKVYYEAIPVTTTSTTSTTTTAPLTASGTYICATPGNCDGSVTVTTVTGGSGAPYQVSFEVYPGVVWHNWPSYNTWTGFCAGQTYLIGLKDSLGNTVYGTGTFCAYTSTTTSTTPFPPVSVGFSFQLDAGNSGTMDIYTASPTGGFVLSTTLSTNGASTSISLSPSSRYYVVVTQTARATSTQRGQIKDTVNGSTTGYSTGAGALPKSVTSVSTTITGGSTYSVLGICGDVV